MVQFFFQAPINNPETMKERGYYVWITPDGHGAMGKKRVVYASIITILYLQRGGQLTSVKMGDADNEASIFFRKMP
jgi:hypothetical protein